MYGSWNKAGYSIDVSLMFDDTQPAAWKNLERDAWAYGFQFARFFGPSGGQKLVESVEIGNEPGKYDDKTYRVLFENVAQGMRRGDPKLLISTCAVYARPSGPYHKNIATVKGLESLYDVINVHSYAEAEGYPTWRRSYPEDSKLEFLPKIQEVISWRNQHAHGKQIWLTEFGWDSTTKPQAKDGDFKKWVGVTDLQQAQYLVRAFLILSELDLDRAYIFWFNDEDVASVHASSGLTRHYQPKPSFHAIAHLFASLGEYRFARVVTNKPGELRVSEFRHGANRDRAIWTAWSPTGAIRKACCAYFDRQCHDRTCRTYARLQFPRIRAMDQARWRRDRARNQRIPGLHLAEVVGSAIADRFGKTIPSHGTIDFQLNRTPVLKPTPAGALPATIPVKSAVCVTLSVISISPMLPSRVT